MKTITIPKRFGYPTVDIYINGKAYKFNSGEEITVDDNVADVIENAIALAPKYGMNKSKFAQRVEGSITEITFSDLEGLDTIIDSAFRNCSLVTSIEISNTVKIIMQNAFLSCTNAKSIRFGDNSKIETIEANAFKWCGRLKEVYLPKTPPTLTDANAFANINASCVFYCKSQESLDAYKSAPNWSTLTGTYTFKVEAKKGRDA